VDRSVQAIIDQLKANDQYENTLIIYTSDNGYQWGEHALWAKAKPYQESQRVPFIALMPGIDPRVDPSIIAPSLDIGPTVFEFAGVTKATEGKSILPLLNDPSVPWRSDLYFEESDSFLAGNAIYVGIVSPSNQYTKYSTGEEEVYDLTADPYQLSSLDKDPAQVPFKTAKLTEAIGQIGLAIIPVNSFQAGTVGKAYSFQMKLWGGFAPFNWTVASGKLPPGITIDPLLGKISGVPTTRGSFNFALKVTDSSLSPQTNRPHAFTTRVMKLVVN